MRAFRSEAGHVLLLPNAGNPACRGDDASGGRELRAFPRLRGARPSPPSAAAWHRSASPSRWPRTPSSACWSMDCGSSTGSARLARRIPARQVGRFHRLVTADSRVAGLPTEHSLSRRLIAICPSARPESHGLPNDLPNVTEAFSAGLRAAMSLASSTSRRPIYPSLSLCRRRCRQRGSGCRLPDAPARPAGHPALIPGDGGGMGIR